MIHSVSTYLAGLVVVAFLFGNELLTHYAVVSVPVL